MNEPCLPWVTPEMYGSCSSACTTFWEEVLTNTNYTCCLGVLHQLAKVGYLINSSDIPTGYSGINRTSGAETAPSFTAPNFNQTSEVVRPPRHEWISQP